jgi:predicted phosphodiesterase
MMFTRRNLLRFGSTAALVAPFAGFSLPQAMAQGAPLFRFGVVSDPQYAPVPPRRTRFYAHSLWKLTEAVDYFNTQDLQFVVTLGDIIDRHWESYDHVLPIYDRLKHPSFFILGNHDFEVASDYLSSVLRVTGLKRAYYDFKGGGYRFIVLDGNDVSLFANAKDSPKYRLAVERLDALKAAKAPNAQTWNGGMSEEQFSWLKQTLDQADAAGERVVVFGHYPIFPENEHNMWDYQRVVDLVSASKNFVAYMNGHNHAGNYGTTGGKHFLNFRGMVETPDKTAYAVVEVYPDRLEVKGYGVQESRTLRVETAT